MTDYGFLGFEIPEGIRAERRRQIEVEGWSATHDDLHADGAMLIAAMLYYRCGAGLHVSMGAGRVDCPLGWPWLPEYWKPKSPRRNLDRAGALCLAEVDRLRRADPGSDVDIVVLVLKDVIGAYAALEADGVP